MQNAFFKGKAFTFILSSSEIQLYIAIYARLLMKINYKKPVSKPGTCGSHL
jgi:hypothetical protein